MLMNTMNVRVERNKCINFENIYLTSTLNPKHEK